MRLVFFFLAQQLDMRAHDTWNQACVVWDLGSVETKLQGEPREEFKRGGGGGWDYFIHKSTSHGSWAIVQVCFDSRSCC